MQSRNVTHDIGYSGRNKSKPSIILQELRVTLAAITAFAITVIAAMILVQHEGGGGVREEKKLSTGDNTDSRNKMEKIFGNFGMRLVSFPHRRFFHSFIPSTRSVVCFLFSSSFFLRSLSPSLLLCIMPVISGLGKWPLHLMSVRICGLLAN